MAARGSPRNEGAQASLSSHWSKLRARIPSPASTSGAAQQGSDAPGIPPRTASGHDVAVEDLEGNEQNQPNHSGDGNLTTSTQVPRITPRRVHSQYFGVHVVADAAALSASAGSQVSKGFSSFDFVGRAAGLAERLMQQQRISRVRDADKLAALTVQRNALPAEGVGRAVIHIHTWMLITSVHPQLRAFATRDGVVTWTLRNRVLHSTSLCDFARAVDIRHSKGADSHEVEDTSVGVSRGLLLRHEILHAARQALLLVQHQLQSAYIASRGPTDCGQQGFELVQLKFELDQQHRARLIDMSSPVSF